MECGKDKRDIVRDKGKLSLVYLVGFELRKTIDKSEEYVRDIWETTGATYWREWFCLIKKPHVGMEILKLEADRSMDAISVQ